MTHARLLPALIALALALPARAPAADHTSHAMGQDALTRQIHRKAIEPGAGITAVVRLGDGRTLRLKVVELDVQSVGGKTVSFSAPGDALAGLKPAAGLVKTGAPAAKRKPAKQAVDQAKAIKKTGWQDRNVGHRAPL